MIEILIEDSLRSRHLQAAKLHLYVCTTNRSILTCKPSCSETIKQKRPSRGSPRKLVSHPHTSGITSLSLLSLAIYLSIQTRIQGSAVCRCRLPRFSTLLRLSPLTLMLGWMGALATPGVTSAAAAAAVAPTPPRLMDDSRAVVVVVAGEAAAVGEAATVVAAASPRSRDDSRGVAEGDVAVVGEAGGDGSVLCVRS